MIKLYLKINILIQFRFKHFNKILIHCNLIQFQFKSFLYNLKIEYFNTIMNQIILIAFEKIILNTILFFLFFYDIS